MKTLGIDLASDPAKTGVCVVEWAAGEAVVERLEVGADDDAVLESHLRVDVTGIDAPFGWPLPFERMLAGETSRWAGPWSPERRDELRFRRTDFMVREIAGRWPLSVSSDLIAVPTMRCVGLLEKMGVADRSGDGRVYETYPACALQRWGFRSTGYKGTKKRAVRERLWSKLRDRMPWLRFSDPNQEQLVVDRDDALDAMVAALIARAAKKNLTIPPAEGQRERARTEGWIHVPKPGSFEKLPDE
jgi:predicted nuclease with RNAse H fold